MSFTFTFMAFIKTLLSKANYNKYICHEEEEDETIYRGQYS